MKLSRDRGRHRRQKGTVEVSLRSADAPVRDLNNSSTPIVSDTTTDKGTVDKSTKTSNTNVVQGEQTDSVRTVTSCFDPVWNAFSLHTDGSMKWIPNQIVSIGEVRGFQKVKCGQRISKVRRLKKMTLKKMTLK